MRLAFRTLVRRYGCDLCFSPMIIADAFCKSEKARQNDFCTSTDDTPLIVQFAARNSSEFSKAALLVAPHCSGVDLNCGCPQRWAVQEGYGACLINKPELVADIIKLTRATVGRDDFTVSVKIRLHEDTRKTVSLARHLEAAGVSFLTVHGRTPRERCEPVRLEAIRDVVEALNIPVIANGDIKTVEDARRVYMATGVRGVMAARGLLANPAMFAGYDITPATCIKDWIKISLESGCNFGNFHHHLMYMLERLQSRAERRYFNSLGSVVGVLDYLKENYNIVA